MVLKEKLNLIADKVPLDERLDLLCENAEYLADAALFHIMPEPTDERDRECLAHRKRKDVGKKYTEVAFAVQLAFPGVCETELSDAKCQLYSRFEEPSLFYEVTANASVKLAEQVHAYKKLVKTGGAVEQMDEATAHIREHFAIVRDAVNCISRIDSYSGNIEDIVDNYLSELHINFEDAEAKIEIDFTDLDLPENIEF